MNWILLGVAILSTYKSILKERLVLQHIEGYWRNNLDFSLMALKKSNRQNFHYYIVDQVQKLYRNNYLKISRTVLSAYCYLKYNFWRLEKNFNILLFILPSKIWKQKTRCFFSPLKSSYFYLTMQITRQLTRLAALDALCPQYCFSENDFPCHSTN